MFLLNNLEFLLELVRLGVKNLSNKLLFSFFLILLFENINKIDGQSMEDLANKAGNVVIKGEMVLAFMNALKREKMAYGVHVMMKPTSNQQKSFLINLKNNSAFIGKSLPIRSMMINVVFFSNRIVRTSSRLLHLIKILLKFLI